MDLEALPLIKVLLEHRSLLEDLYVFIIEYEKLQKTYEEISQRPEAHGDQGLWSRRDLIAAMWLQEIYERNGLPNFGSRKYTDIPSGRNAPEIFYQCVLVILFTQARYRTVHFGLDENDLPVDFQWIYAPRQNCQPIDYKVPCRECVNLMLIPE